MARLSLAAVLRGHDPAENRLLERVRNYGGGLCREYLTKAERGLIFKKRGDAKQASTIRADQGRIEHHIIPLLGKRSVKDITPADVRKFVQDMIVGKTAREVKNPNGRRAIVRGGAGAATRTSGLLGAILAYAVREGHRPDNPALGVERPRGQTREWRLDDAGYRKLGECLNRARDEGGNWQHVLAARAAALTGARLSEIQGLLKTDVDPSRMMLRLRQSKTGKSIQANRRGGFGCHQGSFGAFEFRICISFGHSGGQAPRRADAMATAAVGEAVPGLTLHGLRHSFASVADDLGYSLPTIKALLGHAGSSVTEGYVHKVDTALVSAASRIAQYIDETMNGKETGKVVPLRTA